MQRAPAYNITAVATLDVQRQPPEDAAISRHAELCLAGSFRGPDAADLAHQGCRMSLPGHLEASHGRHARALSCSATSCVPYSFTTQLSLIDQHIPTRLVLSSSLRARMKVVFTFLRTCCLVAGEAANAASDHAIQVPGAGV